MRRDKRLVEQGLQAIADGRRLPSCRLDDPDDIGALRVAIGLRAGRVAADLPSDEFVAALHGQLVDEGEPEPSSGNVSRRALFAGVGAAAAAAAAAVIADRTLLPGHDVGQSNNVATELAPDDGKWVGVAFEGGASPGAAHRFDTPSVVGFVSGESDNLMAVSGTCTHLGCLLQPNAEAGRLDCPCHRTSFGYDGRVLFSQLNVPLAPLPRIRVRRRDGTVEVLIPRET
jgi:cytochrome b6-f complex iron-sulfur subunit